MNKTTQLRRLLTSEKLEFLLEAHNGLSARIAEEAGFKGIWASSLSVSAQLGVRDNEEASWSQVVDVLEFMADATTVPILLDGGTGYGDFNIVRRMVKKVAQRGIAGICIEDKQIKTNSLITTIEHPLADIGEFCGKLCAARDAAPDSDFVVVARVEAFIAGCGLDEALRRADAYHRAGADAILIHSSRATPDEVVAFKRAWGSRCPVVIVPTKYYTTPTATFRDYGFSLVIWANHMLRSYIKMLQGVAQSLHDHETIMSIEDRLVPVAEVFRLQDLDELEAAKLRYQPQAEPQAESRVPVRMPVRRGTRPLSELVTPLLPRD